MNKFKELEDSYKKQQLTWKTHIRLESNKFKRFWKWVWFLVAYPWVWLWYNIRDWHTALIFVLVVLVVGCEVWVPYLIGAILWANESVRISMFSIGSACWIFWLGPGTPFLPLCIGITIGLKALFNKWAQKRYEKKSK